MFDASDHEISTAYTYYSKTYVSFLKHLDVVIILLINVKMPTIVGILTFMSRINFMPRRSLCISQLKNLILF